MSDSRFWRLERQAASDPCLVRTCSPGGLLLRLCSGEEALCRILSWGLILSHQGFTPVTQSILETPAFHPSTLGIGCQHMTFGGLHSGPSLLKTFAWHQSEWSEWRWDLPICLFPRYSIVYCFSPDGFMHAYMVVFSEASMVFDLSFNGRLLTCGPHSYPLPRLIQNHLKFKRKMEFEEIVCWKVLAFQYSPGPGWHTCCVLCTSPAMGRLPALLGYGASQSSWALCSASLLWIPS